MKLNCKCEIHDTEWTYWYWFFYCCYVRVVVNLKLKANFDCFRLDFMSKFELFSFEFRQEVGQVLEIITISNGAFAVFTLHQP